MSFLTLLVDITNNIFNLFVFISLKFNGLITVEKLQPFLF